MAKKKKISYASFLAEVEKEEKKAKSKPTTDAGNAEVLSLIQKALTPKKEGDEYKTNGKEIHKNLNSLDVLKGMLIR